MSKFSIVGDLWRFTLRYKRWWLIPMFIVLILMAFVLIFAQTSPLAPFIYTFI